MLSSLFFVLSLSFSLFIVLSISCRIWNNIITQTISSIHTFVYIVIIFQMERFAFALLFHNLLSTFFSLYFRYYDQIFITKWTKFRFKLHCVWNVNINNGHHRSTKKRMNSSRIPNFMFYLWVWANNFRLCNKETVALNNLAK